MQVETRIHWWNEDKEEIRTVLAAEWRGEKVTLEVDSDRYRTSDGTLTEWRHVLSGGWYGGADEKYSAKHITDTARQRLSLDARQAAESFIGTPDFITSRDRAVVQSLGSEILSLRSEYGCDRLERKVIGNVTDPARAARLVDAIHAYQNFVAMAEAAREF